MPSDSPFSSTSSSRRERETEAVSEQEREVDLIISRHGLRMVEVPVQMRVRETGNSSITTLRAAYYMIKVLLALFIGLFRRYPTPREES